MDDRNKKDSKVKDVFSSIKTGVDETREFVAQKVDEASAKVRFAGKSNKLKKEKHKLAVARSNKPKMLSLNWNDLGTTLRGEAEAAKANKIDPIMLRTSSAYESLRRKFFGYKINMSKSTKRIAKEANKRMKEYNFFN